MPAATITTTSNYDEIHGIDSATGYLIDVDGAFLGVDPAITAAKYEQFITAATAAVRLLRARPLPGTATVWGRGHERLYGAMAIDLEELRGFIPHDATRWLRDAICRAAVERSMRQHGLPLPDRATIYIQALADEIRLAAAAVARLTGN
ncbi:hypothetical protein Br6_04845 [Rhodococcus sp. Br-6]|nr:hypothetical protein Br6_04845 [Rhodococcus sp. Br-6]